MITMRGLVAWYRMLPSTLAVMRMNDAGAVRLGTAGPGAEEVHRSALEAMTPE